MILSLGEANLGLATVGQSAWEVTVEGSGEIARSRAEIGAVTVGEGATLRLSWRGDAGGAYSLERSSNLENWVDSSELYGTGNWVEATVEITDPGDPVFLRIR